MDALVPHGRSKYGDETRRRAAVEYAIQGNLQAVANVISTPEGKPIPRETLRDWRKTDWWDSIVTEVRQQNADAHISAYNRLTEKALKAAERGIDELEGQSLTAADIKALTITGCSSTDKSRLLQNLSTSNRGSDSSIASLANEFRRIARDNKNIMDSVVSTQVLDKQE